LYQRYHIETGSAPDIVPAPGRFRVKVKKIGLAGLILKEIVHYRGNWTVVLSRPCMYGVFSGPVGGFAPREHLCVGCLRCTTQYPEFVQVSPNPERLRQGDSFFSPDYVDALYYEARNGKIPVRGAGYRGPFGGVGWDGMWTDMSEIVRPTRDGIHGREFISTAVDIGSKPAFLAFDDQGRPTNDPVRTISLPLPMLLDSPPASLLSQKLVETMRRAAEETETLLILPIQAIQQFGVSSRVAVPLVKPGDEARLDRLSFAPAMIELDGWHQQFYERVRKRLPEGSISLRLAAGSSEELANYVRAGVRIFHVTPNYHGRWPDGRFVLDLIRDTHRAFLDLGCRDEVTLLGSGGIILAEHVAKSIICGLDAVALDTPVLVALQAEFLGECVDRATSQFRLPTALTVPWAAQRVKNLLGSWRDQLLEIMGAMGIREVRRLRGEIGRAMFQKDLEREAFAGIEGYV